MRILPKAKIKTSLLNPNYIIFSKSIENNVDLWYNYYNNQQGEASMSAKSRDKCFIITPIGDETDPIRRHIEGIISASIIPAIGEKYEIVVAHKINLANAVIVEQMCIRKNIKNFVK